MEQISVFDILKVGIGPSSSHTLGPWRAAGRFLSTLREKELFEKVDRVCVTLYGSLSLTGRGHYTDLAVILGLCGADPEVIPPEDIRPMVSSIEQSGSMTLGGERSITFSPLQDIVFEKTFLPFHSNGITFVARDKDGNQLDSQTYYSIGGGFVVQEGETPHVGEGGNIKKFP